MKYYIIIFVVIFISGCQGILQVEQSIASLPKPENTNQPLPDLFTNHCEVDSEPAIDILSQVSLSTTDSYVNAVPVPAPIAPD
ncbi:hypothetical protein, partial [Photobacterium sp. OFAV2-7]|uniref:hypothetical protein n=1 Tax=Photobacterium sp. OFAV2-7 TaxID=2917748 RepID=UPI001EF4420C